MVLFETVKFDSLIKAFMVFKNIKNINEISYLHVSNLACLEDHLHKEAISVKYKSNKQTNFFFLQQIRICSYNIVFEVTLAINI